MKINKELNGFSSEELRKRLGEFRKELLKLNVQVATGANPESPGKLKQIKKNIARVLTFLESKGVKSE